MFRNDSIIMMCTSLTQALAIVQGKLTGTGSRGRMAHFRVTVGKSDLDEKVYSFESVMHPDQFLQLKGRSCDCEVSVYKMSIIRSISNRFLRT